MPNRPKSVDDKGKRKRGKQPSSTQRGYGVHHRRLRQLVLQINPVCMLCRSAFSCEAHHIEPVLTKPPETLTVEDYWALCKGCHKQIEQEKRKAE